MTIHTIGHSTRPIDEFLGLLRQHSIDLLVDIRTVPRSRRNPQYEQSTLPATLHAAGIDYLHLKELGGLRRAAADSVNTGWRNASFRGYADYMQTPAFERGLATLLEASRSRRAALMCAEAVPWRCHRSLVADALLARGIEVIDILGRGSSRQHALTRFAKVEGFGITYPETP